MKITTMLYSIVFIMLVALFFLLQEAEANMWVFYCLLLPMVILRLTRAVLLIKSNRG